MCTLVCDDTQGMCSGFFSSWDESMYGKNGKINFV